MQMHELKVGTVVRCIDADGWGGFKVGGLYKVSRIWDFGLVSLEGGGDSSSVSETFFDDFEVVNHE